jgi:phage terminase small subunit
MPRKTVAELKLLGTYRKDRHGDWLTPLPVDNSRNTRFIDPPARLTETQQRIWREKLATLPTGFVGADRAETFEAWVVCRDEWLRACEYVAQNGVMIADRNGNQVKNPAVSMQTRLLDSLRRLEAVLRLNDPDYIERHRPAPIPAWMRAKESA